MTDLQSTDPCPHCRNTTAVHSLGELAAMMRTQPSQPSFTRMIGQLTGEVFFLAGGTRVIPMPKAGMLTLEQSDALVTQLRQY